MVSSTGMTLTAGIDAGMGEGARAASPTGRAAATRWLAVRYATSSPQRVRAFMRVSRSAKASTCCGRAEAAVSARRARHGGRRERAALWFDAGGPGPLTEDRQKPRSRLDGRRGTRNTVPSRAPRPHSEPRVLAKRERLV